MIDFEDIIQTLPFEELNFTFVGFDASGTLMSVGLHRGISLIEMFLY